MRRQRGGSRTRRRRTTASGSPLCWVCLVALSGCGFGSAPEPPGPGWERGSVPDLRGDRVLLLPAQLGDGSGEHADRELRFALQEAGPSVGWLVAEELEEVIAGVGRLGADVRNLPVAVFEAGEVRRVGDPLFGTFYRMAALTDARWILLPVSARTGSGGGDGSRPLVVNVALLDPRTGRVLWQGIVQGVPGDPASPAPAASAAERIARRILP